MLPHDSETISKKKSQNLVCNHCYHCDLMTLKQFQKRFFLKSRLLTAVTLVTLVTTLPHDSEMISKREKNRNLPFNPCYPCNHCSLMTLEQFQKRNNRNLALYLMTLKQFQNRKKMKSRLVTSVTLVTTVTS